ncbi:bifunctional 2',3'-cyclic-nucleotide 2'-phosphodiesterase/3'-nucleotidase [Cognatiyoonia sp. IB215182]|uniref:bifunctional 2',3'-cyclic-nucleotide 2'-phosphodiesterase/3'-nucleotidase n=1 Tax=Cognatiyoonia sp. IB215182 TaxID=3097353 RepID=UPI002A0D036D|nr:bifunctional 2',3'-cyclic-nucleotide 2'-phosphodiesterase/3'-nucleotidase [Cognatiyoonia sp. IB215182]MDX8351562.1 bifunctional 2',3'-cyclic-nucleotide 2'-phosphodiesterase/3'-nucleotidase [Cognatiyoonia sp. IB215182]
MFANHPDLLGVGPSDSATTARLRILETTDLHMHLLDYDYFAARTDQHYGLIRLIEQIESQRRDEGVTTLLFDNGDFAQGNPLADYLAAHPDMDRTHPMINAFNTLSYDAITLGNHEFNYGLDFLRRILAGAQFPVVCANIDLLQAPPLSEDFTILKRTLQCSDGQARTINIGVTGFVTPQITEWDRDTLAGKVETEDIVACAKRIVPQIKAAGADLIVALCHSGIGPENHHDGMENAAIPLAAIDGIDVLLTGHTHEVFPDPTWPSSEPVDPVAGTLHGKPAVKAGFYGNHLGVIDLDLDSDGTKWRIDAHRVSLATGATPTEATGKLHTPFLDGLRKSHAATVAYIQQPIATTTAPIHTYFTTIVPDLSQQLLADAQREHVKAALADTANATLPIISATAPFLFGGQAGPGHYIDLDPGPITLRDAAAIYPFENAICAIKCQGRDLRAWLEPAAAHFTQLTPGQSGQMLIAPHSPGYNYDTLDGLYYEIDLSQPAETGRITDLNCQGRPVADDDVFILVANSYRTFGGGNYPTVREDAIVYRSTESARDILIADLQRRKTITPQHRPTWTFKPLPGTEAMFLSSPKARGFMTDKMRHLGPGRDGFDRFALIL